MDVTSPVSVSFSFPFAATDLIAYGCRMIGSVDCGFVADGLIAYGSGMTDSDRDVVDGLVVHVISESNDGRRICGRLEQLSWFDLL